MAALATWLTDRTGNALAPSHLLIGTALVTLLTVFSLRETRGEPLPE
jgi:MHS family proline/betaine transporter-like MFS transporter